MGRREALVLDLVKIVMRRCLRLENAMVLQSYLEYGNVNSFRPHQSTSGI